jgi:hypothetical protein
MFPGSKYGPRASLLSIPINTPSSPPPNPIDDGINIKTSRSRTERGEEGVSRDGNLSTTRSCCRRRGRVGLEDESGEAEETSEASARKSSGLASAGGGDGALGSGGEGASRLPRRGGGVDLGGPGGLGRGNVAGVADDLGDNGHRLGDRARAVGDGESGSLSDGIGGAAVGDLGGRGAEGGDSRDDLSGVGHVAPGVGASNGSKNGSERELHFCGDSR